MNGLAGFLAGYDGSFKFDSGGKYPSTVNYKVMRIFNALFGAFMVPLAYYTGIHLRFSHLGAILMAVMVLTGKDFRISPVAKE